VVGSLVQGESSGGGAMHPYPDTGQALGCGRASKKDRFGWLGGLSSSFVLAGTSVALLFLKRARGEVTQITKPFLILKTRQGLLFSLPKPGGSPTRPKGSGGSSLASSDVIGSYELNDLHELSLFMRFCGRIKSVQVTN
jgi:hypothetical protein